MNTGGLILIIGSLAAAAAAFIWLAFKIQSGGPGHPIRDPKELIADAAAEDIEHIFNDDFREELRNRGRLHFEKIINENAEFLQQDLRNTSTELNEYMRTEITRTLKEEFKKYEQSINDAKQLAMEAIQKTVQTIDQQREFLEKQIKEQSNAQQEHIIARFESEMAAIFNHYIVKAIGDQIDLSDQLDFILGELESNKQAILEDIKHGAS